jgi:hypothetical protein
VEAVGDHYCVRENLFLSHLNLKVGNLAFNKEVAQEPCLSVNNRSPTLNCYFIQDDWGKNKQIQNTKSSNPIGLKKVIF